MPHFLLTFGDASQPPVGAVIIEAQFLIGRDRAAQIDHGGGAGVIAATGATGWSRRPGYLSSLPAWSARCAGWAAAPNLPRGIRRALSELQRVLRSGSVGCRCLGQNGSRGGLNASTVRNLIILVPAGRKAFSHFRKLLLIFSVHQKLLREASVVVANEGGLSGFGQFGKFGCVFAIPLCCDQRVGHRALLCCPP
jgi:hypothetical protein